MFAHSAAVMINFFSITALFMAASLFGMEELSAEIAVVQGAIIAVFFSLSGNARNLILSDQTDDSEQGIFKFRLIMVLPAIFGSFYLASTIIEISAQLIYLLILRKSSEWLLEIELANKEKYNYSRFAYIYIFANAISFLIILIHFILDSKETIYFSLYFWALIPVLFLLPKICKPISLRKNNFKFMDYIPNIGSSMIIGITVYFFRVLIVLLVGKAIAGHVFTAYALGGVISSIYTYVIGPALILKNENKAKKIALGFSIPLIIVGLALALCFKFIEHDFFSSLFMDAVSISIIGGGVMLVAQYKRLYIIQKLKRVVFVPDALANIFFLSSVPFLFYLFGNESLNFFFLLSSLLNLMLYQVVIFKIRYHGNA